MNKIYRGDDVLCFLEARPCQMMFIQQLLESRVPIWADLQAVLARCTFGTGVHLFYPPEGWAYPGS